GRWQYRLRGAAEEPLGPAYGDKVLGLPPSHPTLPSLLGAAGYRTALMGKWHLGYPPNFGPRQSGYQTYFGYHGGGVDYFAHTGPRGGADLWENETPIEREGYLTDLLSRQAVEFVEAQTPDQPFLLSLHYSAPHWPWLTRDDAEESRHTRELGWHPDGGSVEVYQKMIHHMDEGIGRLMAALREHGLEDNTLVVFTSDNGGERFSDSWPLVGGKMDLTEGGIRVPWIAHWPAAIPAGTVSTQHCMTMDWSATLLEAGGGQADPDWPLDGVSLLKVLREPAQRFQRPLYWRMNHRGQRALREGDWKYLQVDGHEYLFNIAKDERERANLATRDPERLERMQAQWLAWDASVPPIPADASVSLGYSVKDMPQR
ncbi:MAG: sulfatase-like hydrolase/transferase, partial [Hydrogenophaga sp.]|nr:sulfatase-like hydrolase/transferase [Hydrogenophaga sp.]